MHDVSGEFQFALPRGERRGLFYSSSSFSRFQFALPRGERQQFTGQHLFPDVFQFALPRGERRKLSISSHACRGFQFALPRGERPHKPPVGRADVTVSIRAPARGATSARKPRRLSGRVSIRAPARGATWRQRVSDRSGAVSIRAPARGATTISKQVIACFICFNSRSREGSDRGGDAVFAAVFVSIRAPARGATAVVMLSLPLYLFQFALPRGERRWRNWRKTSASSFQFALPRGERLMASAMSSFLRPFQFALPRGERRGWSFPSRGAARVSIRAPARGATRGWCWFSSPPHRFNSRSREGSDPGLFLSYIHH